jgi:hypothetical protein
MRLVFCGCVQLRTANLRHCEITDHANLRGRLFVFGKVPGSIPVLVICLSRENIKTDHGPHGFIQYICTCSIHAFEILAFECLQY